MEVRVRNSCLHPSSRGHSAQMVRHHSGLTVHSYDQIAGVPLSEGSNRLACPRRCAKGNVCFSALPWQWLIQCAYFRSCIGQGIRAIESGSVRPRGRKRRRARCLQGPMVLSPAHLTRHEMGPGSLFPAGFRPVCMPRKDDVDLAQNPCGA